MELQEVEQEVQRFTEQVSVTIASHDEEVAATEILASILAKKKKVDEFCDPGIEKAKATLDELKEKKTLLLAPIIGKEQDLKRNLIAWRMAEEAKAKKAQDKANAEYQKRLDKAVEKGKPVEAVKPAVLVQTQAKTTKTEAGAIIYRDVKKLVIFDEAAIPLEYKKTTYTVLKPLVKAAIESGKIVPGARIDVTKEIAGRGIG